ncbi:hypothetical protein HK100_005219 [Physocladia obscura]|uniref:NADH:flavin oxidoreductase/NADH oxidase N-terminal domain-containing protein n=1 Tax=Physocladia obscura TaxID=109957 RepID=A0AAD5XCG3_9FUNG|nr:hypothetical protein HK100_005219 [Physocladia obscura]
MSNALFEPILLGDIQLKNRIVLAPMTRFRADEEGSIANDLLATYYSQRASDGGLLISEATSISEESLFKKSVPGIYTNEQIAGWKNTLSKVHAKGGKIVLQLWHIGLPDINALDDEEIEDYIAKFVQGAENAIEAGFDGVEIHGANSFLIDQFLNESTNKRTDKYGGSTENRNRFALKVTEAVISVIGAGKTGIRLSPWAIDPNNKDVSQWISLLQSLTPLGLSYAHIIRETPGVNNEPETEHILGLRRAYGGGNLILNRGYVPATAERSVADGSADLIAFGKLFIANPDLVERIRLGRRLNENADSATFYEAKEGDLSYGYTTYPTWEEEEEE